MTACSLLQVEVPIWLERCCARLDGREGVNVIWASAILRNSSLASHISDNIDTNKLRPQEHANLIWALTKISIPVSFPTSTSIEFLAPLTFRISDPLFKGLRSANSNGSQIREGTQI